MNSTTNSTASNFAGDYYPFGLAGTLWPYTTVSGNITAPTSYTLKPYIGDIGYSPTYTDPDTNLMAKVIEPNTEKKSPIMVIPEKKKRRFDL